MAAGTYERKTIVGGAPQTTIVSGISAAATSITLTSATGWPDETDGNFVIAVDTGGASEEKMLCSARSGVTITVATRGYDDTTALTHDAGAVIDHVLDASTVDQANRFVNLQTAKGAFVIHNGTNPVEMDPSLAGDGSDDDYVLLADNAAGTGWSFGRLETVTSNASAPAVAGTVRVWIDTTSKLVRFSDGTSWVIASTIPSVADDTARDTLLTGSPTAGSLCYREDFDFVERYTEAAWKPLSQPKFTNTTARDAYFTAPVTGDTAFITGTHAEYQYREDEWILINRKITTSASAPASPHDGDIWLQPA